MIAFVRPFTLYAFINTDEERGKPVQITGAPGPEEGPNMLGIQINNQPDATMDH